MKEQFGDWLRERVRVTEWVKNTRSDEKIREEAQMGVGITSRNSIIGRVGSIGEGKEMACSSPVGVGNDMDGVEGVNGHRQERESEGGPIVLTDIGWDGSKTVGQVVQIRESGAIEGSNHGKDNTMSILAEDGENSKMGQRKIGGKGEKQGVE